MKSKSSPEHPLRAGKVAPELLAHLLPSATEAPDIQVGPNVGEDAAVVAGEDVMVVTADPVTFATSDIGRYAVAVNCNDLVAMGAVPRFFTATLLLPLGTTRSALSHIFNQLDRATAAAGVAWIGGHTEITDAVRVPVVAGSAIGSLAGEQPWSSSNAQVGDRVVATKWMGLEGSTLLARERAALCRQLGLPVDRMQAWLTNPGIDIVAEGRALAGLPLHAAHDPTEGGFAQGLHEIAACSGVRIELQAENLPLREETAVLCRGLDIDPMGLLASGSLLFAAPAEIANEALRNLKAASIPAVQIGHVAQGAGVVVHEAGRAHDVPTFVQDEVVKVLRVGKGYRRYGSSLSIIL